MALTAFLPEIFSRPARPQPSQRFISWVAEILFEWLSMKEPAGSTGARWGLMRAVTSLRAGRKDMTNGTRRAPPETSAGLILSPITRLMWITISPQASRARLSIRALRLTILPITLDPSICPPLNQHGFGIRTAVQWNSRN